MLLRPEDALSIGWKSYILELYNKREVLCALANLSKSKFNPGLPNLKLGGRFLKWS